MARVPRAVAAAVGCLLLLSCGKTNNPTSTGLVASFAPDAPSPPDGSVTLQAGQGTGALVEVRVSARKITDLFGAAFWISFDTASVGFAGYDDSTSLLRDGGEDPFVLVNSVSSAGTVKVEISRVQNAGGTVEGVDVTDPRDLIVLTFGARKSVVGSPIAFMDGHGEVSDSAAPAGNPITVTWAGGTLTAK
jgi:hypothetical protein